MKQKKSCVVSNENTFSVHILFFGKDLGAELFTHDKLEVKREEIIIGDLDTYLFNDYKRQFIKAPNTMIGSKVNGDSSR